MPASNLTRSEAETRSATVTSPSYEVRLDLTRADGFRSESTVRFGATPGAETFVELVSTEVHEVRLNGELLDAAALSDGTRLRVPGLAAQNELHRE